MEVLQAAPAAYPYRSAAERLRMDESRVRAYRVLLAQGLLHLKWDLARFYGGLSLTRPWELFRESRAVRAASFRAFAFHNLAIWCGLRLRKILGGRVLG